MEQIVLLGRFASMGGTRTFFLSIIDFYLKENYKIHLFLYQKQIDQEVKEKINNKNINVYILPNVLEGRFSRLIEGVYIFLFLLKNLKKYNIDKIIYSDWNPVLDLFSLFSKKRSLFFVHTYPSKNLPRIFKILISNSLKNKQVVTVSEFSRELILEKWINKQRNSEKVKCLYNYSNIEIKKKEEQKVILTLGHVRKYKNPKLWFEVIKEIAKEFPNLQFIWAGEGELLEVYREKSKDYENINFIGYEKDVANLYSKSLIYIQLSLIESHGISVIDAMKYSLPCIVSEHGGLPESVIDGKTGYIVNLDNKVDITNKIKILILNADKRANMGKAAYKQYQEKFSQISWDKKLKEISEID